MCCRSQLFTMSKNIIFNMKTFVICAIILCTNNVCADGIEDLDLRENVRFFLYTRNTANAPEQLHVDDQQSIETTAYNVSKDTKFYTHDFNNSYLDDDSALIRSAFLTVKDYNMIVIDWGNIAETYTYEEVANNTAVIGAYIAKFADFLVSLGSDPNDMSLVGNLLGSHIVESAGYLATNTINHVVGLDPIREGFETDDLEGRISAESATLVEVIHTSHGSLVQMGDLDFYSNGGDVQLGCENSTDDCSRNRAYQYYAETLTIAKNWLAVQCDSYDAFLREDYNNRPIMSYPLSFGAKKTNGIYFSRTKSSSPYGLGFPGLRPSVQK